MMNDLNFHQCYAIQPLHGRFQIRVLMLVPIQEYIEHWPYVEMIDSTVLFRR
jgi:hypothetical protein